MGQIIHYRSVSDLKHTGLLIYCCTNNELVENATSINRILAEKLFALKPKRRTMQLAVCFENILNTLSDNVMIKEFDVMFNPDYRVDVLKIMVDTYRRKKFSVIWPGKYEDGKLLYAEDGCQDFKVFSIEEYDVICVV